MAIRTILQIGDPKLKARNRIIKNICQPQIKKVIQDLIDTMHINDLIGIASPQIGENFQIFITEPRKTKTRIGNQSDQLRIFINPRIVNFSKEESVSFEGCGSVLNGQLFAPVRRPKQITIEACDNQNQLFRLTCDGLLGRVIQHEYDHLAGIEFTEKITDYKKMISREFYIKRIKDSIKQNQTSKITIKRYIRIKSYSD